MFSRFFNRNRSPSAASRNALGREFREGDVLEQRFEIEKIRLGFMGIVYIAYDRQRRERVVLKTFQNKFLWDEGAIARFSAEAELWMRLGGHPNIVRAYDIRYFLGKPHVVAEYIHGGPLRTLVGHISFGEALDFAIQICWGMSYAVEQAGIMHCDLKPDNIMITHDGDAKVTDFGLSRVLPRWQLPGDDVLRRAPRDTHTHVPEVLAGTLPYMAPELFDSGSSMGPWSDIYAFGVMFYELLTGKLPFDAPRDESMVRMHMYQQPPDPRTLRADVPPDAADIILRCMHKRPSRRYDSFRDVERDLQILRTRMYGTQLLPKPGGAGNATTLTERGLMHMDLREYSEAITSFRRAIESDSTRPEPYIHMARARLKLWQYNETLHTVEQGLARASSRNDYGQLYQVQGEALMAMLRPMDAAAAFDKGLSYTPNAPALWREKGALFLRQGLPREARDLLEKALRFDKLDPRALRLLGDAYMADENPRRAYRVYGDALKLDPRSAEGWTRYGQCQLQLARRKEAASSFEMALKLDPDLQEALEGLRLARKR